MAATAWSNKHPDIASTSGVAVFYPRDGNIEEISFEGAFTTTNAQAGRVIIPAIGPLLENTTGQIKDTAAISVVNSFDLDVPSICVFVAAVGGLWVYESDSALSLDRSWTVTNLSPSWEDDIHSIASAVWKRSGE